MKHTLAILVLLFSFTLCYGQQATLTKEDYLKKSKKQKTTAWILLGSGVAIAVGGMIAHFNHINNDITASYETDAGVVAVGIGLLTAGGSIPLFIASSKNKKNAMSLSLKNESAQQLINNALAVKYIPSVCLKIAL